MFYLLLTILLNVVNAVIFKVYPKYNINVLQAIVTNYIVCVITGCLFIGHVPLHAATLQEPWLPWALAMGGSFIFIFNLMAYCTRLEGITTTTIANKLSLVIPVLCSVWWYHEHAGVLKIAGVVLALPAVYLTTRVKDANNKPQELFWPAILFVSSGALDALVNHVQLTFLTTPERQAACTIVCFATASIIGIVIVVISLALGRITFAWKNVAGGICLGIPNFFSIFFLIKALDSGLLHSSATIPVINIGILVATSLTAILLFREQMNRLRLTGLVLAVIAILLIAFGDK